MSSLNQVQLIGNLGSDPEVKSFANGGRVANFSIATSETWKDKTTGERKEKTEWHNVTVNSDGLVGVVESYCRKGSKVFVQGKLQTRKWQDRDGNDRYTTEVVLGFDGKLVLLGSKDGGQSANAAPAYQSNQYGAGSEPDEDMDDDVPFIRGDRVL